MDDAFSGIKFFIFDGNPIKIVWEEGIITECYRVGYKANKLVRDDRLAYYLTIELCHRHEISQHEFDNKRKSATRLE
jgi:hypothetical protein